MNCTQLDWSALDRLRGTFINRSAADAGPYWRTPADLANYDITYAERIGWKWDAVLSELHRRAWTPPPQARALLDWGCGSGVASRRVLRAFGPGSFNTLLLWDHSPLARDYAAKAARREFPELRVEALTPDQADRFGRIDQADRTDQFDPSEPSRSPQAAFTLVVSHVINELPSLVLAGLLTLARDAGAVIWVEPGTHADSRALVAVREQFRASHDIIAPCTHSAACGLLAPGSERHWCHNFAEPPRNIFADSNWVKFGQRAGVDLRSLPYSFLVLERKVSDIDSNAASARQRPIQNLSACNAQADPDSKIQNPHPLSRIIGRPRIHKAHAAICNCDAAGVTDLTLYKRDDPALFKTLDRSPAHPPLYAWKRDPALPARILGGSAFQPTSG